MEERHIESINLLSSEALKYYWYMDKLDIELYDILSDKTYSEWCLIKIIDRLDIDEVIYVKVNCLDTVITYYNDEFSKIEVERWYDDDYFIELIWHEPTFQDIALKCNEWSWNWIANSNNWLSLSEWDCNIWNWIEYDFTKKLLKQTDSVKRAIIHHFYTPNEE